MRKRVMLVDDHPAMLMALKSMLQDQLLFEIAGQAQNGEECLRSCLLYTSPSPRD